MQITTCHTSAANVHFSGDAQRHRLSLRIENVHGEIRNRFANQTSLIRHALL